MSTTRRVRCGVAGTGYLGQHHARIYASLPNAQLTGILEADDARAAEICTRYGCRRFTSVDEMAEACDAVSVAVPTDRHADIALPLLRQGCHLLIEKPLCTTLEEARRILDAARASGSIVQVGHIEHFNPVVAWLEKEVHEPRLINAYRLAPWQPRGTEVGVVLDLMIHDIGIVLKLARSQVERIEAAGMRVISTTEDIANARITFRNGCVATLQTSRVSTDRTRRIEVFQPSALLWMDFINQDGYLVKKLGDTLQREHVPLTKVEPLRAELEAFVDSIVRRVQPAINAQFGADALALALEITQQIRGTFGSENLTPVRRFVTAASPNRRVTSRTFLRAPEHGRPDLLVIAGEHSGDQHAAAAVRDLRARHPELRIAALGGPALRAAGAQLLLDMTATSVVGFAEVLRHFGHFWRIYRKTLDWIATYQPRAVCFVDYPGLNLRLATSLQRHGITRPGGGNVRALYYISPQVWAWKSQRRHTMAKVLDALAVIFPFEVDFFRDTSLPIEFVGHPLLRPDAPRPLAHTPDGPVLLLPGSRTATVERNLPVMLQAFTCLRSRRPTIRAALVVPDRRIRALAESCLRRYGLGDAVEIRPNDETTSGAAALVASGTISLQAALAGIPGALAHRTSLVSWEIGRRLVKIRHVGMPNLLLREPFYPEFLQGAAEPETLAGQLESCLGNPAIAARAAAQAAELRSLLTAPAEHDAAAWLYAQLERSPTVTPARATPGESLSSTTPVHG